MHFFAVSVSLLFAASTWAYGIGEPSGSKGWTKFGTNTISWKMVNTDPMTVAVVLTNQNRTALPEDQIIIASMNGTQLTAQVHPPTGGWPMGSSFRLNFVKDSHSLNTILAQTSEFSITSKDNKTLDVSVDTPMTTTSSAAAASGTSDSSSVTISSSASSNGALPTEFSNNGLAGLLVLLGAALF